MSKIVLIEWVDSEHINGWCSLERPQNIPQRKPVSIGMLAHEDARSYILIGDKDEDNVARTIVIPKCSVRRIRPLKVTT